MSYQLVKFEAGGAVQAINYVYNPTTQKGVYSLIQNDGYFRRSNDGINWSGLTTYGIVDEASGAYKLAYGSNKYVAALGSTAYIFSEPTAGQTAGSWSLTSLSDIDGENVKILYGSGNLALLVTDVVDNDSEITFSQLRTINAYGQWSTGNSFEYTGMDIDNGIQETRIIDFVELTSGLYAFLVVNVSNQAQYKVKICSLVANGIEYTFNTLSALEIVYGSPITGYQQSQMKLLQVRNNLYVVSQQKIHSVNIGSLLTGSFTEINGVDKPDFSDKNIQYAATDGRTLLINTYNPVSDMNDLLYTYNPSTRVWMETDVYQATSTPKPSSISYDQILSAPGKVVVLDNNGNIFTTSNLKSWQTVNDSLVGVTDNRSVTKVFNVNNRTLLSGVLDTKNYLLVNEKITRRSPNFVPKCG